MTDYRDASPSPPPDSEDQLWADLEACVSTECSAHESIDDALRSWLDLTTRLRYLAQADSQDEVVVAAQLLEGSALFQMHREYIRTQIIHSLLQEDDTASLHAIACLLLLDGEGDESIFPSMIKEACFPRLLELIGERKEEDPRVKMLLLQLMYEMSRMERLREDDLELVDDDFIHYLFRIVEGVSNEMGDPYHYPTIRVLLVLNEQYMLASTDSTGDGAGAPHSLTNRIVKCLSLHGPAFRTFGENIILLLNRETETSLQLLILKLLYLLFTTKATYEYFYTNDLRVLVDVILRNLMDLPDEKMSLRHTYLRVLYPLLAHTQLNQAPHYKRGDILRVLGLLRGSHNAHFAPADETTLRLVDRVGKVPWLKDEEERSGGAAEVARKFLGISLGRSETASSISVSDVAAVMEKPGVQTPSRKGMVPKNGNGVDHAGEDSSSASSASSSDEEEAVEVAGKKPLPVVPKHRHGLPVIPTPEVKVNGAPVKKVPPKAPPPRRWGKRLASGQVSPGEPAET